MTEPQQPQHPQQGQPYPPQGYQQAPPAKKKHTVRNVLLVIVLLLVLVIGGCMALIAGAANEVDKALDDEAANDKPVAVTEGAAFTHDGFAAHKGWSVAPAQFGGATIKGLEVTLKDDQDVSGGGRSALLTFRLYDGKKVVSEITCSSKQMQEGETSAMDCTSLDTKKLGSWDTIKVADAF